MYVIVCCTTLSGCGRCDENDWTMKNAFFMFVSFIFSLCACSVFLAFYKQCLNYITCSLLKNSTSRCVFILSFNVSLWMIFVPYRRGSCWHRCVLILSEREMFFSNKNCEAETSQFHFLLWVLHVQTPYKYRLYSFICLNHRGTRWCICIYFTKTGIHCLLLSDVTYWFDW